MRVCVKFFRAFFKQNDGIDIFNVVIVKTVFSLATDAPVLPQEKICRVAGAPLAGEQVSDLLHLYIGNTAVLQFHHNIHDQQ